MKTKPNHFNIFCACLAFTCLFSTKLFADAPTYRGKIVLVVDKTLSQNSAVEPKIERLVQDLSGDGWRVLRHDVERGPEAPPSDPMPSTGPTADALLAQWVAQNAHQVREVRALIMADYGADPGGVKAVFLLGHVAIPYSGDELGTSGGHTNWWGANAADPFYGEMTSVYGPGGWSDLFVDNSHALTDHSRDGDPADPWEGGLGYRQLVNIPGDGKFDQDQLPSPLELAVGRVDLSRMPAFNTIHSGSSGILYDEPALLSMYLDKDHDFRSGNFIVPRTAWVSWLDDPSFAPEYISAYENMVGANNVVQFSCINCTTWFRFVSQTNYLLGYGAGYGGRIHAETVGDTYSDPVDTYNFVDVDSRVVFVNLYGSVFGLWDQQDDFLRAPLANPYDPAHGRFGYGLTSLWGRGAYDSASSQQFVLGSSIGESMLVSAPATTLPNSAHFALMGDPSLRLHTVLPPTVLTASLGNGTVNLTWSASGDSSVSGYNIYSAPTGNGPYVLVNTSGPVTGLTFSASRPTPPSPPDNFYMIRAVKTETTPVGQYINMSEGAILTTPGTVTPYLKIVKNPASMAVVADTGDGIANAAAFTVDAFGIDGSGNQQVIYQWYKGNQPLSDSPDGSHILGANSSALLIKGVQVADAGAYSVVVSYPNGGASVASTIASLSVDAAQPTAANYTFSILRNTPTDFALLPNNSTAIIQSISALSDPSAGTITINSDQHSVHFVPAINRMDAVTFTYIVTDGIGASQGQVTVNFTPQPGIPPTLSGFSDQQASEDTTINIPFNVSDPNTALQNLNFSYSVTSQNPDLLPNSAFTVTWSQANPPTPTLVIKPGTHQIGTANVNVTVRDYDLRSVTVSFNVSITPISTPTITVTAPPSGGVFSFGINGPVGLPVEVLSSDDLLTWQSLGSVNLSGNLYNFSDNSIGSTTHRFYFARNANGPSVNTVGFVITTVPAGKGAQAFIANQLINPLGNTVSVLLPNVSDGTKVFKWDVASQTYPSFATFAASSGTWNGSGSSITMNPGEGVLIQNHVATSFTVTFIGDVPPGQQVNGGIPSTAGKFAMVSSIEPISPTTGLSGMGFPAMSGDVVKRWDLGTQQYDTYTFDGTSWSPSVPAPSVGEAFFIQSGTSASRTWTENVTSPPVPALSAGSLSGNNFQFTITGANNAQVNVEATGDFVTWTSLGTVTLTGGSYNFVDSGAGSLPQRFYAVREGSVISANTYGFMNVTVPAGNGAQAFIANQLINPLGNTVSVLLPSVPNGTKVFKWDVASQTYPSFTTFAASSGAWNGSGSSITMNPGEGVLIQNHVATSFTVTFIGDVPPGQQVNGGIPSTAGKFAMVSSIEPISPTTGLSGMGFPAMSGDVVKRWDLGTQQYDTYTFDGTSWSPSVPAPSVGEAFFIQSGTSASRTWTENVTSPPVPALSAGSLSGNNFQFTITGANNAQVNVEATGDFVTWTSLGTVTLTGGSYNFVDSGAGSLPQRFYAVREGSVISANTYGFMNVTVPAGNGAQAFIANQLINPLGNTVSVLLPSVPNGTKVFKWDVASQTYPSFTTFAASSGTWNGSGSSITMNPGEGVLIQNHVATSFTVTFIGDVPPGQQVNGGIPSTAGKFAMVSSIEPISPTTGLSGMGFPAMSGDVVKRWDLGTQQYDTYTFDGTSWSPSVPAPSVGEAFFIQSGTSASRTWTENFDISPP